MRSWQGPLCSQLLPFVTETRAGNDKIPTHQLRPKINHYFHIAVSVSASSKDVYWEKKKKKKKKRGSEKIDRLQGS
ncbi:hypothetical protein T02_2010 [Trichinella nativa]|uniref:Uncharacterized protein n=1 Tax=Trichinella nativa TaxID=6335 RepID=A0A0V1L8Z7_9BILA|nr:hypothetical protein T02_2010 [Trichinella nativa]